MQRSYSDRIISTVIMTAIKGTEQLEGHEVYVPDSNRKYLLITLSIIVVAYLISMSTDCLGVVLELNGILAAVPLAYVLPALCYLRLEEGPIFSSKKIPALGLMSAGIFAAVSGLLLIILNNNTSESCLHGKIMPYCLDNSTTSNDTITPTVLHVSTMMTDLSSTTA